MATIDLGKIKQVFRGTYNNATAYAVDDLVVFTDGSVTSTYICTTASTGNNPSSGGTAHANWAYVAKGQATSPTTTQGDLIVRGASADERLAIGAAGKALKVNSSANGLEYGTAGGILQVVQTTKTDTASTGSSTFADILTVSITPASSSSKFLLIADLKIGYSSYTASVAWKFVRDSTSVFIGDAAGSRTRCTWGLEDGHNNSTIYQLDTTHGTFLDSPNTTSAITYKVQGAAETAPMYLNRTGNDGDSAPYPRTASSLTVMEVTV